MVARGYRGDAKTLEPRGLRRVDVGATPRWSSLVAVALVWGDRVLDAEPPTPSRCLLRAAKACATPIWAVSPRSPDVSLTVRRGERVALLGANGCGKSTLLKVLDGLVFPDAGTYTAFGEPVTEDTLEDEQMSQGFRSRVGFVFQNSDAQVFSPSVREEVAFGPLQLGMSREEAADRVRDVLAMLGITELADRAPFQLSGGQKKKVAIATVLVMNPEVLLFDEPTAALDPRTQHWLVEVVERARRRGQDDRPRDPRPRPAAPHRRPRGRLRRGPPHRRRGHARGGAGRPRPARPGQPCPSSRSGRRARWGHRAPGPRTATS